MSVMQIYREAWKKEDHETSRQRRRDVVVSIATPSVALSAMIDTFWMYWREGDTRLFPVVFFILLGAVLSFRIFVHACHILTEKKETEKKEVEPKEDEKNQSLRSVTMLAFATWLFPMGLAFTLAETYDELYMHIGPLELDPSTGRIGSGEFSSPWGDALLAFSAFCMLAEEFSLFKLYDGVRRKVGEAKMELETILSLSDDAKNELNKIVDLHNDTEENLKKVEELHKRTKVYSTEIQKMHTKMRKERNLALVILKWCSVVGGIVLLLYILIEVRRLEMTINTRTIENVAETSGAPEGFDQENEDDGASGQGRTVEGQTTMDADESSTMDSPGTSVVDTNRPDDLDDTADGTAPPR